MNEPLIAFSALTVLFVIIRLVRRKPQRTMSLTAQAVALRGNTPSINYTGNPYRSGAFVYVCEDSQPSEHDWLGTFIGMLDGMALVRDHETHTIVNVAKDQLYSAQR